MTTAEQVDTVRHGKRRPRVQRSATMATIVGSTIVASALYGMTGSWSWASTIETASDGRPITAVQLTGAATGWGELVILALGAAAWIVLRKSQAHRSLHLTPGIARLSTDRLIGWMWLYVAAVWFFTIVQAVVAIQLVQHHIVPPFLINGTVHLSHL